jgi:aminopeptidase N
MIGALNLAERLVVAHEVAHEWFQALVGNDQFTAPWVDESVAEFLSRLFFAERAPYCSSRPIDTPIFDYPDVHMLPLAERCGSYYQTVYLKGQAMYWGLRARMGGAALLRALRAVVREHAWDLVSSAEMRQTLVEHGAPRRYLDGFLRGG